MLKILVTMSPCQRKLSPSTWKEGTLSPIHVKFPILPQTMHNNWCKTLKEGQDYMAHGTRRSSCTICNKVLTLWYLRSTCTNVFRCIWLWEKKVMMAQPETTAICLDLQSWPTCSHHRITHNDSSHAVPPLFTLFYVP